MKSFEDIIDEIIANMDKQRESAKIKAFVTDISMMLRANGVIPYMSEVTAEIDDNDALKTVFCCRLEKLDFSEHDKVFEDKIAELKKDYKTASELLGKYQQENESLKQRIDELEKELSSVVKEAERQEFIREMSCLERQELKQRIAELESKETKSFDEVPDDITIDGYKCKIIKTESGLYISRDEIYSIIDKEKEPLKQKCKELDNQHQLDCIEINRLNTTIDVLIHKVEYLRQFAGLE